MRAFLLFVVSINFFLVCSCKKYKPANPAFFIKASQVSVKTTSLQGSGSSKISDLWLYVNGQFKGAYPVGNLMPIPNNGDGKAKIIVYAGIKNNGISDTRIPWNFYLPFELDTIAQNGTTFSRSFAFQYRPATTFTWTEDFEQPGFKIINSPNSGSTFSLASASESFEGKSLKLEIVSTNSQDIAQLESSDYYPLPIGSSDVYLELNYKNNAPVSVGVIGSADPTQKSAIVLNTQENWNKIYIQLSTAVSIAPQSSKYKVYFQLLKTADYPNPKLFLDNIKLIYIP